MCMTAGLEGGEGMMVLLTSNEGVTQISRTKAAYDN